jgi:hypothetical protein
MADAATDLFKKEDVQTLAKAVDLHDHSAGKGLALPASAIPNGLITSAMIADGTIATADLADGSVATAKLAANAVTQRNTFQSTVTFSTTTTSSWVTVPGALFSITPLGGNYVVVEVSATFSHSGAAGAVAYIGLMKDGTPAGNLGILHVAMAAQNATVSFVWTDLPTATSHTYQLAVYNATAGTLGTNAGTIVTMVGTEYRR